MVCKRQIGGVLKGLCKALAQPAVEVVCCEVHPQLLPAGVEPDAVSEFLRKLGFTRLDYLGGEPPVFHLVGYEAGVKADQG